MAAWAVASRADTLGHIMVIGISHIQSSFFCEIWMNSIQCLHYADKKACVPLHVFQACKKVRLFRAYAQWQEFRKNAADGFSGRIACGIIYNLRKVSEDV